MNIENVKKRLKRADFNGKGWKEADLKMGQTATKQFRKWRRNVRGLHKPSRMEREKAWWDHQKAKEDAGQARSDSNNEGTTMESEETDSNSNNADNKISSKDTGEMDSVGSGTDDKIGSSEYEEEDEDDESEESEEGDQSGQGDEDDQEEADNEHMIRDDNSEFQINNDSDMDDEVEPAVIPPPSLQNHRRSDRLRRPVQHNRSNPAPTAVNGLPVKIPGGLAGPVGRLRVDSLPRPKSATANLTSSSSSLKIPAVMVNPRTSIMKSAAAKPPLEEGFSQPNPVLCRMLGIEYEAPPFTKEEGELVGSVRDDPPPRRLVYGKIDADGVILFTISQWTMQATEILKPQEARLHNGLNGAIIPFERILFNEEFGGHTPTDVFVKMYDGLIEKALPPAVNSGYADGRDVFERRYIQPWLEDLTNRLQPENRRRYDDEYSFRDRIHRRGIPISFQKYHQLREAAEDFGHKLTLITHQMESAMDDAESVNDYDTLLSLASGGIIRELDRLNLEYLAIRSHGRLNDNFQAQFHGVSEEVAKMFGLQLIRNNRSDGSIDVRRLDVKHGLEGRWEPFQIPDPDESVDSNGWPIEKYRKRGAASQPEGMPPAKKQTSATAAQRSDDKHPGDRIARRAHTTVPFKITSHPALPRMRHSLADGPLPGFNAPKKGERSAAVAKGKTSKTLKSTRLKLSERTFGSFATRNDPSDIAELANSWRTFGSRSTQSSAPSSSLGEKSSTTQRSVADPRPLPTTDEISTVLQDNDAAATGIPHLFRYDIPQDVARWKAFKEQSARDDEDARERAKAWTL